MATSLRSPPVGRTPPKTWSTFPEEHRRLLAESSQLNTSRISALEDQIDAAVPSATGQLLLMAASASFPDLGSVTWEPITQYDSTVPAIASSARGVTLDPVAGTISPKVPGLWRLDFTFSMTHNENNAGRTLELRTFNVTDSAAGDVVSVAIGRNQPGLSYAINTLLDIGDANLNDEIRIEAKMATGSAGLNTISFTELGYIATYVDAFENLAGDLEPVSESTDSRLTRLENANATILVTTTPYTAGDEGVILVDDDAIGGPATVILPPAAERSVAYHVKKLGTTGTVTIDADGGELIDNQPTQTIGVQNDSLRLAPGSGAWWVT